MSQTSVQFDFSVENVLVDATTAVMSDPTGTYGVKRTDTDAVVVADGTALTNIATGIYQHTWTDPAPNLTYDYWGEFVFNGRTVRMNGSATSGTVTSGNLPALLVRAITRIGDVPDLFLNQRLRAVFRDFCIQTGIWREQLATFVTVADQSEYTLVTSFDATFLRVTRVEVGDLTPDDPNTNGSSKRFQVSEEGVLAIWPTPAVAGDNVVVWATLLPKESITSVPVWMVDRWGDSIVNGLIADLKLMANRPWTDFDGGLMARRVYDSEIARAKTEVLTRRGPVNSRVIVPPWV